VGGRPWARTPTADAMAGPMGDGGPVKCEGCGLHVERQEVLDWGQEHVAIEHRAGCERCVRCTPDVRAAFRRGFNAGLDAMAKAAHDVATRSNLRKRDD
jgi:hypothetical protein